MTVLSVLRLGATASFKACLALPKSAASARPAAIRLFTTSGVKNGGGGHEKTMVILPSRYQWQKYKDLFHFYFMLGVIPVLAIVFYTNVFIGPATLTEIPPGYRPKHWEYERHPISRFIARYLRSSDQEVYERNMFYINQEDEIIRLRILEKKILELMGQRGDYPNYYSEKVITGKYLRFIAADREYNKEREGPVLD